MDPCCALKYYPDIELCVSELNGEEKAKQRRAIKEQEEDFGDSRLGKLRKTLWNLTENPETSKAALILGYCSLGLVIVSTITFVLSTFPGGNLEGQLYNLYLDKSGQLVQTSDLKQSSY